MKEKKLVIVKDSGPIPELSFICGPVLNPTRIDIGVIAKMVGAGRTVYECNPFNTKDQVLLDITNVKSNNFTTETVSTKDETVVEEVKEETKETPEPVQETVVEETEKEVTEPEAETVVEEAEEEVKETPVQKPQNNYQQNKKNKNKNNKH